MALLPREFYTLDHPRRWVDPFVAASGEERRVLTPTELKMKDARNLAYWDWMKRRKIPPGRMIWQAVRILHRGHSEYTSRDWWKNYQDCLFRVFINPVDVRCPVTNDYKQWYVLSPEDSEMVLRHEMDSKGHPQPPRNPLKGERWVSKNKRINKALLVPVECCHQYWRENENHHTL